MREVAKKRLVGFHRVRCLSFLLQGSPKVKVRQFDLE
jgi:hypothetical protein